MSPQIDRRKFKIAVLLAAVGLFATLLVPAGAQAASDCTAFRIGDRVTLSWTDDGGRHVVRRDGQWIATLGAATARYTDPDAPTNVSYEIRSWIGNTRTDRPCTEVPPPDCTVERIGTTAVVRWADNGGRHIVRRNGQWIASAGRDIAMYTDHAPNVLATYEIRTWLGPARTDTPCLTVEPQVKRVLHVTLDGLRSDYVTPEFAPNLAALYAEGASTLNARTDIHRTKTLPNHTSQFTGLPVLGTRGHQIEFNEDRGTTVHEEAGRYIASVFDVVHDNSGGTAMYQGKPKFDIHDRSWNELNGAPDLIGPDDGRDKIDTFVRAAPENLIDAVLAELAAPNGPEFTFFHIRTPDSEGHEHGWDTIDYAGGVTFADTVLGGIIDGIQNDPVLASSTIIIVTADHGGPTGEFLHDAETNPDNYTIPFGVWGPGVAPNADLYDLNVGWRVDPGTEQPTLFQPKPIRGHEVANLALDLLGYGPVPGSLFNFEQDLVVS